MAVRNAVRKRSYSLSARSSETLITEVDLT
jgi:hypothetical protein